MFCRSSHRIRARSPESRGRALGILLFVGVLAGCDSLLKVEAPTRVLADDLEGAPTAALLVDGVVGDFECAYASLIQFTAQHTDEMVNANLASAEAFDVDRRTILKERTHYAQAECGSQEAIYMPLSRARWQADNALRVLEKYSDAEIANRVLLMATAAAYSGYNHLLLGEAFCTCAIDGGAELTSQQLFTAAEAKFSRAITEATTAGNSSIRNMALVGRARARLNLGKTADAVADAQQVPGGFVRNATYSSASGRSENRIFRMNNLSAAISIEAPFRNVTFQGVPDPRVVAVDEKRGSTDNVTPLWTQRKYSSLDAPIPIARYQEAQLIIAEVTGGQAAVNIINALHAAVNLPPFNSNDAAEIAAQVQEERRREFFLEGHRFYDRRRFNLPQIPAPGTSYGFKGGFYGNQLCLPLPDVERDNNPTLRGS
ncbi:MAG: RagB/SusD family nutrient uptake outer membrane protein [Gemmatimonadetes bacterium]|nr:RagB/SusD family nutrient uptake outer membrane protein [Gemmatimonadota bacterium]